MQKTTFRSNQIRITNKCIRRRNIAFLQACQLQIWQLLIAKENTRYIIIALEFYI
jgi:hypothetical protein